MTRGPDQQRLLNYVTPGRDDDLNTAEDQWRKGASILSQMGTQLRAKARAIRESSEVEFSGATADDRCQGFRQHRRHHGHQVQGHARRVAGLRPGLDRAPARCDDCRAPRQARPGCPAQGSRHPAGLLPARGRQGPERSTTPRSATTGPATTPTSERPATRSRACRTTTRSRPRSSSASTARWTPRFRPRAAGGNPVNTAKPPTTTHVPTTGRRPTRQHDLRNADDTGQRHGNATKSGTIDRPVRSRPGPAERPGDPAGPGGPHRDADPRRPGPARDAAGGGVGGGAGAVGGVGAVAGGALGGVAAAGLPAVWPVGSTA